MLRRGFCLIVVTLWSLCVRSDTQTTIAAQEKSSEASVDPNPGLTLTKLFFRNITRQFQESVNTNELQQENKYASFFDKNTLQGYHHHEHHWGPYFEAEDGGRKGAGITQQIAVHIGSEALLHCRVGMLKDKTVMWLRRTPEAVQLLTVGLSPYAGDSRISVKFQYPNNWRLSLNPTRKEDAGLYMCQISTHPPRATLANLTVLPPILTINGDDEHEEKDRYYKEGSKIELKCDISNFYAEALLQDTTTTVSSITSTSTTSTTSVTTVKSTTRKIGFLISKSWSVEPTAKATTVENVKSFTAAMKLETAQPTADKIETTTVNNISVDNIYGLIWKKNGIVLEEGVTYSNISSTFLVSSPSQNDSGTYACLLKDRASVIVNLHVLIGENQAAVHHDTWNKGNYVKSYLELVLLYYTLILICEII